MFLRALRVVSPEYMDLEFSNIFEIGHKLCYPYPFLQNCLSSAKKTFYQTVPTLPFNSNNNLVLPFSLCFSDLPHLLNNFNISVAFKYETTIKNLLVRNNCNSLGGGGVYSVECSGCLSKYYGQTGKQLSVRINQHKYNVRRGEDNSAFFVHMSDKNHLINWNSAKFIYRSNDPIKRNIIECAFISQCDNFNLSPGLYKIDALIKSLIHKEISFVFRS